ncbi:major facilitator superfamily domain-containing protein 6 [Rhipicephalus sanguineus]|uniref:major facilitator superfamily domain-containing protein 6 n=1 Tax=Rhipicephalus sanguineus TaxID=34632 RepID=UPI0018945890|nr:major facilitator superfamily domain-containing protein 6 [Rhipicephalus sanguineus]
MPNINLKELPMKAHYFFYYGALSGFLPFIGVLIKDRGVSAVEVGLIYTVAPFFSAASKPIFGAIVDHSRKIKVVILSFLICIMATFAAINFLPAAAQGVTEGNGSTQLNLSISVTPEDIASRSHVIPLSQLNLTQPALVDLSCHLTCIREGNQSENDVQYESVRVRANVSDTNLTLRFPAGEVENVSGTCNIFCPLTGRGAAAASGSVLATAVFWLYCIFVTVNYAAIGCANSLTDTGCFELLESEGADSKSRFGLHRLWGTVGWGIFAAGSGYLIDGLKGTSGPSSRTDYSAGLYLAAALMLVDAACVCICDIRKSKSTESIAKDVFRLVYKDSRVWFLLLDATIGGVFVGIVWQYHFWYLDNLGASSALMGATVAVRSFAELPVFVCAGWAIGKAGHVFVLRAALVSMALSFALYSIIVNPWVTLPVELLLGLALGAFFTAIPSYAEEVAPPGTEATTMGLVMGFFEGIGTALGGMVGGAGFEWLGGASTFQLVAVAGFTWCLLAYALDASFAYLARAGKPGRSATAKRRAAAPPSEHGSGGEVASAEKSAYVYSPVETNV